jgi:hypothetical protein
MQKLSLVLFLGAFACALSFSDAADDKGIKPVNLPVNTADDEDDPHVADGGLGLYWTATEKDGKFTLKTTRRKATTAAWPSKSELIDDYVSAKGETRTCYGTQGRYPHYLFFAVRDKMSKNFDIYVAQRFDANKVWSAPTPAQKVCSADDETAPWMSFDGKSLYFSRKTKEGWKLFVSQRTAVTGPAGWQEPEEVGFDVDFHHATTTPDGKTMYLQGPTEKDKTGIYVATKAAKGWSKPELVEGLGHADAKTGDRSPNLSRDGTFLYFASDRPEGKGGLDLWVVPTKALVKKR